MIEGAAPEKITAALRLIEEKAIEIRIDGSVWRHFDGRGRGSGKWLSEPRRIDRPGTGGYRFIYFAKEPGSSRTWNVSVHRLMWTVYRGPIPEGMEINHIDSNPGNNELSNLELVTRSENVEHSHTVGKMATRMRLAEIQRRAVRFLHGAGYSLTEIAGALGIESSYAQTTLDGGESSPVSLEWLNQRALKIGCTACQAVYIVKRNRRRRDEVISEGYDFLVGFGCEHVRLDAAGKSRKHAILCA